MRANLHEFSFFEPKLDFSAVRISATKFNFNAPDKTSHFITNLRRDPISDKQTYSSKTLYGMLGTLGGFFGLFGRIVGYVMSFFNGFNLHNSMVKRLYSVHDENYKPKEAIT